METNKNLLPVKCFLIVARIAFGGNDSLSHCDFCFLSSKLGMCNFTLVDIALNLNHCWMTPDAGTISWVTRCCWCRAVVPLGSDTPPSWRPGRDRPSPAAAGWPWSPSSCTATGWAGGWPGGGCLPGNSWCPAGQTRIRRVELNKSKPRRSHEVHQENHSLIYISHKQNIQQWSERLCRWLFFNQVSVKRKLVDVLDPLWSGSETQQDSRESGWASRPEPLEWSRWSAAGGQSWAGSSAPDFSTGSNHKE